MRYVASVLVFLFLLTSDTLLSQESTFRKYSDNKRIELKGTQEKSSNFFDSQKTELGLTDNDKMTLVKTWTDISGMTRERYRQFHNDLPVVGGTYTLHSKSGYLQAGSGNLFPYIKVDENVSIAKNYAAEKAIQHTKQILEEEEVIVYSESVSWDHSYNGLCIIDSKYPDISGDYRVAHSYTVSSESYEMPIKYQVYIDAHTGKQLCEFNEIKCGAVKGTAKTRYYGEQEITTDSIAPDLYLMKDMTRGDGVVTLDFSSDRDTFSDRDNIWGHDHNHDGETYVAGDAHYCTAKYYDMMLDYFDWDGLDGDGGELVSVVNVFGKYYVNAFWNGSATHYGNGDCHRYGPLTTMTVVGHEFAHGWTDKTSDLIYRNESGALNESISDIIGKGLEYYADRENFTWNIGDLIRRDETINVFRSMSDPHSRNHPKYYGGEKWRTGSSDAGGVHSNSGVFNYWFYLLVEGVSDVNERDVPFNVQSIGMRKALDIVFLTQTAYLTENSTYFDCMYSTIQAVKDIYGDTSPELESVIEAWKAVGLYEGIDDIDFAIELAEENIALCPDDEVYIEAIIRNVGRKTIPRDTTIEVTFLQNLTPKIIESLDLSIDLEPGDSIIHTFKTPVVMDIDKDGIYKVSVESDDANQLNNTNQANLYISDIDGLELSLERFELQQADDCDSEISRYSFTIRNQGCVAIPEDDYLYVHVESDQGEFDIERRLFSEIRAGIFYGSSGSLPNTVPDNITSYTATLMYEGDISDENNTAEEGIVEYQESITRGYRGDFESELDIEKFKIEEDTLYYKHSVVDYKSNNMLAIRGVDNHLRTLDCDEPEGFFDAYGRKSTIRFCIDATDIDQPIFSFDMLKLSNEYRERPLSNEQFGGMVRVSTDEQEYPFVYAQPDDALQLHEFELPSDYVGPLELEVLTVYANTDRDNLVAGNLDVVMFDNFRLYDDSDIQPDYDKYGYSVAPNPVDDMLRVESLNSDQPYDVLVFDRLGRLITTSYNNQNITMIDMYDKPQGIYFITILQFGTIFTSHRVVKM